MNLATALHNATARFGIIAPAFSPSTLEFLHAQRQPVLASCEALDLHTRDLCQGLIAAPLHGPWTECLAELRGSGKLDAAVLLGLRSATALTYMRSLVRAPLRPVAFETQAALCGDQLLLTLQTELLQPPPSVAARPTPGGGVLRGIASARL